MKLKTLTMTVSLALFRLAMSQIALAQKNGEAHFVYFDEKDRPTFKFTNESPKKQRCGALVSYTLLNNQEEAIAVRGHHLHLRKFDANPPFPEYGWLYITSSRIVFIVINGDKSHSFDIPRTYLKDKPVGEVSVSLSRLIPDPFSEFGESMIDEAVSEPNQSKSQFDPPNPDDPSGRRGIYHAMLSMIDAQNGKTDQVRTNAEKALQLLNSPSNDSEFYAKGVAHHKLASYDLAIADFDKSIQLNPNRAETYFYRGKAHYDKGDYKRAVADFDKAILLSPQDPVAYHYRGTLYLNSGDNNRAVADYSSVILLKLDYGLAYQTRAIAYERIGDKPKAKADWDKVAEIGTQKANPE